MLLTTGSAAYGFTNAADYGTPTSSLVCSLAILTDDVLNGNTTVDGTVFFAGLNTLVANLGDLNTNLTNIKNNITDLADMAAGTTYTAQQNVDAVMTKIQ